MERFPHGHSGRAEERGLGVYKTMAIPLSYNLRNLTVRKTTTLMTALGIALTVAVLVAVLALAGGLRRHSNRRETRSTFW